MDDQVCNVLSEVDDLFTKGSVNAAKFNKFTKFHSYCPHQNKCTNDYERVNALGSYLFKEIMKIDKAFNWPDDAKRHIEVFMIWLGDKLFKIDNDYKITLEESYKNNLESIMGNTNYWEAISKKLYKKATIKKMNEFYNLLSQICKIITEYNKNPQKPDSKRLGSHSTRCINFYRAIYLSANGCKPYLQLLDSLKMIYEVFRMYKIDIYSKVNGKEKELLLNRVKSLTIFKDKNQYLVSVNAKLSFDDKECIDVKSQDERIGEKKVSTNLQGKRKDNVLPKKSDKGPQTKSSPSASQGKQTPPASAKPPATPRVQPQPVAPVQSIDTQQSDSQKTDPLPSAPPSQDGSSLQTPKTGEIHKNGQGGPGDGAGGTVDRKGETSSGSGVTQDSQGGSSGGSGDGKGSGAHGSGGAGVRSGYQSVKDSQEGMGGGQGSQGITSSEPGGAGSGPDASKSGQKASDTSKGNKDDGTNDGAGTPGSGANGGGSTKGDQGNPSGGLSNQGNPSVGSNDQGDKSGGLSDPASSTGGSFDLWSPFREFILNGTEIYNKTFQFIKENQQRLNDAKDQISNAYDSAVNNLKSAYSVSSSYFSDIISNISSQFNQVGTPPKPGNSGNSPPQNNDQSQKNGGPSSSPTKDPPPKDPQSNSIPTTSKDPSQLPPQLSSSPTPQQPQQSFSQPQPTTHQNPQAPAQVNQPNSQKIGQLVKSLSSDIILKKPWNIFPTTWNGSGDCKPEIKFMNTTLVCCTSEQCSLTGILITLVLIPIILLIAYKYLSFGSSKKSEKKNMKKVINFHDGNRKTKIIISSNDRNKDLKPVINSVGRKKDSLLNIYKLIRADPMPFINLFFLLIFFVYKRKRDTIE
ncbi:PIR protein CIR protein [Plasmodium vinckei brucechwatti]|uniref:PIR protein CIR protein n=1 Tax=Plasmodium vinckei brucechwatti TaxID=119398 RepID=A0A6V7S8D0_PLAVN|nr:PIR protein CIR protein [Plasmodium vinckei brucechwatti]